MSGETYECGCENHADGGASHPKRERKTNKTNLSNFQSNLPKELRYQFSQFKNLDTNTYFKWLQNNEVNSLGFNKFPYLETKHYPQESLTKFYKKPRWPIHKIVQHNIENRLFYRWVNRKNGEIGVIMPNGKYVAVSRVPKGYKKKNPKSIVLTVSIIPNGSDAQKHCNIYIPFTSLEKQYLNYGLERIQDAFPVEFVWVDESKGDKGVLRLVKGSPKKAEDTFLGYARTSNAEKGLSVPVFLNALKLYKINQFTSTYLHELCHFMGLGHPHGTNETGADNIFESCPYRYPTDRESNLSYSKTASIFSPFNSSIRHQIIDTAQTIYGEHTSYPNAREVELVFFPIDKQTLPSKIKSYDKKNKKYTVYLIGPHAATEHVPNAKVIYNFSFVKVPYGGSRGGILCHTEPGSFTTYNSLYDMNGFKYSNGNFSISYGTRRGVYKVIGTRFDDYVHCHNGNQVFTLRGGGDRVFGNKKGYKFFHIDEENLSIDNIIFPGQADWSIIYNTKTKHDLIYFKAYGTKNLHLLHERKTLPSLNSEGYWNKDVYASKPLLFHELLIHNYFRPHIRKNISIWGKNTTRINITGSKSLKGYNIRNYRNVLTQVRIAFNKETSLKKIMNLADNKLRIARGFGLGNPQEVWFSNDDHKQASFKLLYNCEKTYSSFKGKEYKGHIIGHHSYQVASVNKSMYGEASIKPSFDMKNKSKKKSMLSTMTFIYPPSENMGPVKMSLVAVKHRLPHSSTLVGK